MADTENDNENARGTSEAGDPLVAFATALRDMCSLASFVFENALMQGDFGAATERFTPFLDPIQRATSAFRDLAEAGIGAFASEGMLRKGDAGKAADMASLLAQAYLVATASGMRYWRRVAETYGAHQSAVLRSLLARVADRHTSDGERRALIDEIRAYLREVGDVSLQEARIFQSELDKLGAEVATAAGNGGESSAHRRRWKAKP